MRTPFPILPTLCTAALALTAVQPAAAASIEITLDTRSGTLSYVSDASLQFIGLFLQDASLLNFTCDPPAVVDCNAGSFFDASGLGLTGLLAGMRTGLSAMDFFPATASPLVLAQTDASNLSFERVSDVFSSVVIDADGLEVSGSTTLFLVPEPGTTLLAFATALALAGAMPRSDRAPTRPRHPACRRA